MKTNLKTRLEANAVAAATARRADLRKLLPNSLIVLKGRSEVLRNFDHNYPFRQFSDFLFLTAFDHPDARLILHPRGEILFIPKVDQKRLVWLGEAETTQSARERYGFRRVCYLEDFDRELAKLAAKTKTCHANPGGSALVRRIAPGLDRQTKPLQHALIELRMIRNADELALLQHACDVGSRGHEEVMRATRPGRVEFELLNVFQKHCADQRLALSFPPILASGHNGAVMHYYGHGRKMRSGDLLLVDAGAECRGYASDITRTIPVSGKFTKFQRKIYEIVLEAEQTAIAQSKPGVLVGDLQKTSVDIIRRGLLDLGILKGSPEQIEKLNTISLFQPYVISHTLGLDVHDVFQVPGEGRPGNRKSRPKLELRPGFVLTVEPGIYFIKAYFEDAKLRRKHAKVVNWDMVEKHLDFGGVRIEDDIVITDSGHDLLTDACAKADDIEKLMAE